MAYSTALATLVEERIGYLEDLIEEMSRALENAPPGKLRINNNQGKHQYYQRLSPSDRSGKYIPVSDFQLAKDLAEKEYNKCVLELAEAELKLLKKAGKSNYENILVTAYGMVPGRIRELLDLELESNQEYGRRWASQPYKKREFREGEKVYISRRGEKMHSKSECLISGIFDDLGLFYLYERPLLLEGHMPDDPVFPDFTILDVVNRKELFWEHFGMMDNQHYVQRNMKKIMEYQRNGIKVGENLIVTFESLEDPIDLELVERLAGKIASGLWSADGGFA